MPLEEFKKLNSACSSRLPSYVADVVFNNPVLKNLVLQHFLKEINKNCQSLCVRKRGTPSVLVVPPADHKKRLEAFSWEHILKEIKDNMPFLLDVLSTIAIPCAKDASAADVAPICTAYSVLMNQRWNELSLVQKINTTALGVGHATKKTFDRLAKMNIVQSRSHLNNIMDDIGKDLVATICEELQKGRTLRIVFDNFDFRILANVILKNHRNSDMHWIGQFITFDRVESNHLDDNKPLVSDVKLFPNGNYLLSQPELQTILDNYTILAARILIEFVPCLEPLSKVIPVHISHVYSKEMKEKSTIINMPIQPFNQSKHSDVCQYLDYIQKLLVEIIQKTSGVSCSEAEESLKDLPVPLFGDQLGRERVTGAKKTRLGCDLANQRFENIVEAPSLWHVKQSFLGYIWEQLYKPTAVCGREVGTLYYLRQHFGLTNVKSDVKKNYKAAESLMLSATKASLCSAFMTWSGMETLDDEPVTLTIPQKDADVEEWQHFLEVKVKTFVKEFVMMELDKEKKHKIGNEMQSVERSDGSQQTTPPRTPPTAPPTAHLEPGRDVVLVKHKDGKYIGIGLGKVVTLELPGGKIVHVHGKTAVKVLSVLNSDEVKPDQIVMWPNDGLAIRQTAPAVEEQLPMPQSDISPISNEDSVMNYGLQILQMGFILLQLNDTEREGDGNRSLLNWKLLILYFRSRPRGMKYAFEAMRCITMVKALYTERTAHRVLHGQFVNQKGGAGKNCANDLKMEHMVKNNKVVLKGLCGNKTLKAIQRNTAAAYGLQKIMNNFDQQSGVPPESTAHTHANKYEDEKEMIDIINKNKTFTYKSGRSYKTFPVMKKSPLEKLNVLLLDKWLTEHKEKLFKSPFAQLPEDDNDADDGEISEEEEFLLSDAEDIEESDV